MPSTDVHDLLSVTKANIDISETVIDSDILFDDDGQEKLGAPMAEFLVYLVTTNNRWLASHRSPQCGRKGRHNPHGHTYRLVTGAGFL